MGSDAHIITVYISKNVKCQVGEPEMGTKLQPDDLSENEAIDVLTNVYPLEMKRRGVLNRYGIQIIGLRKYNGIEREIKLTGPFRSEYVLYQNYM